MARRPTVALWGAGMVSMAHAAACRALGWDIVAVASRTPEHARRRAAELRTSSTTYEHLREQPVADTVIVCTPPQTHADDVVNLLDAGYAVVVEKPLCRTLAEADVMVSAATRPGRRLLYAENLAAAPAFRAMLRQVPDLGALSHLEARALQSLPTWGAFTTDEWGGGALFDLGVHPVAVVLLLARVADAGPPVGVACELRGSPTGAHGSDEHAEVRIRFASGLVADVVTSWQAGPSPYWDVQAASSSGVVRAELLPTPLLERNGEPLPLPTATTQPAAIHDYGYLDQLRGFDADVVAGRSPVIDAVFGRDVLDVVCAAYASAGKDSSELGLPFDGPRDLSPLELWRGY